MSRRTYSVNGITFPTQGALRNYLRDILSSYDHGETLSGEHFAFVRDLIDRHPRAKEKIGCGIRSIFVQTNPIFRKQKQFWIERNDGSKTDFSFEKCLSARDRMADFKSACRTAIAPDVIQFKKEFFAGPRYAHCPITGERLTWDNAHVDHEPPLTFDRIVADFMRSEQLDLDNLLILGHRDGEMRKEIGDIGLRWSFIAYHRERARLRIVSQKANLTQKKR